MYLSLVVLLLAAVLQGSSGQDHGSPPVIETKAMKVEPTNDLVASGFATISFNVMLPNMSISDHPANLSDSCQSSMGVRYQNFCTAIDQIMYTSNGVLTEISSVFVSLQEGFRRKRALIPWLGDIRRWIEGTATERQLNKVITSVNSLGNTVESLKHSNQVLINVTNINNLALQGFHGALESRLKNLTSSIEFVFRELSQAQLLADQGLTKLLGVSIVHAKINLLQTHLLAVRSIFESCKSNVLSSVAVPSSALINALQSESRKLSDAKAKFIFDISNIGQYYKLTTAHCQLISNNSIQIRLAVPIAPIHFTWHVLAFSPLKFLVSNLTCAMFTKKVVVASDGVSIRDLSDRTPIVGTNVYVLPRFHSPSNLHKCISSLVHDSDMYAVRQNCPLECESIIPTTVQVLNATAFTILNPSFPVHVICSSRVIHKLSPISDGRYDVTLPCDCVAQDISPNGDVLIPTHGPCISESSVQISNDWAGSKFSSLSLFIPHHRSQLALDDNATLPPLHLVTPPPLPQGAIWHDLPTVGSGKVEVIIWGLIGSGLVAFLAYCLQDKCKVFTGLWQGLRCLCTLCRRQERPPEEHHQERPYDEVSRDYVDHVSIKSTPSAPRRQSIGPPEEHEMLDLKQEALLRRLARMAQSTVSLGNQSNSSQM